MTTPQRISDAYKFIKERTSKSQQLDNASLAAFLVSLLPVPILSQSAAVLDRLAGDQAMKNELGKIWDEISKTNTSVTALEDSVEKIQQIAATVKYNTQITEHVRILLEQLLAKLESENSEWRVLTKNWSFQAILNSIVDVDAASIASINHSKNVVQNTRIYAQKTDLIADNNSSNVVDKSSFHGKSGTVAMTELQTKGLLRVQNDMVAFGENGMIGFGENGMLAFGPPQPTKRVGTCSFCRASFEVDISRGMPALIQCPNCRSMLKAS